MYGSNGPTVSSYVASFLTSPSLRVENVEDALQTLWLVECGLLPPTRWPLNNTELESLGNGNVLAYSQAESSSLDEIFMTDDRGNIPYNGLHIFRERKEMSTLCRCHFRIRRNPQEEYDDTWLYLVAYNDHADQSKPTPKIQDIPELHRLISSLPPNSFHSEPEKSLRIPPVPLSLPHIRNNQQRAIRVAQNPPDGLIDMKTTAHVEYLQTTPFAPDTCWSEKNVETELSPASHVGKPPVPSASPTSSPLEVTHLEVDLHTFEAALIPYPSSVIFHEAARAISSNAEFLEILDAYAPWTRLNEFVSPDKTRAALVEHLRIILDFVAGEAEIHNARLRSRYDLTTVVDPHPFVVAFPKSQASRSEWESAALFICVCPHPAPNPRHPTPSIEFSRSSVSPADPQPDSDSEPDTDPGSYEPAELSAFGGMGKAQLSATNARAMLRHALYFMSHTGIRHHVIGIDITGFLARFWYFDRAGSVYSTSLDFREESERFIAIILSLQCASDALWGSEESISLLDPTATLFADVRGHELEVGQHSFTLIRPIHITPSLFGRCTAVYEAHAKPLIGATSPGAIPETVIVKLAWQPFNLGQEDELFRRVNQYGVDGVATLYSSARLLRLSQGLRASLCLPSEYLDRELRTQIMGPLCAPLYSLAKLSTFKQAFRSLVRAHRDLYEKAGILHRDISINNLMVEATHPERGILIDLDLAVHFKEYDLIQPVPASRVGTLPFMATELISSRYYPPFHYYRHDLESFFFVLAWITVNYRKGKRTKSNEFLVWSLGSYQSIAASKRGYLSSVMELPTSQFPELREQWLAPIAKAFVRGYETEIGSNPETLEGSVTYESLYSILMT